MDKKTWAATLVCMLFLVAWGPIVNYIWPPRKVERKALPQAQAVTPATSTPSQTPEIGPAAVALESDLEPMVTLKDLASTGTLENEYVKLDFTSAGAGIRTAVLKGHRINGEDRVTLNEKGIEPILKLRGLDTIDMQTSTKIEGNRAVFEYAPRPELKVVKTFELVGDYRTKATLLIANTSATPVVVGEFQAHCGTSVPLHELDMPLYIGYDTYDGSSSKHHSVTEFHAGNFLFIPTHAAKSIIEAAAPFQWMASRNQFFITLVTAVDQPFVGLRSEITKLPKFRPEQPQQPEGVSLWAKVAGFELKPGESKTLEFELFTGPREYWRLKEMGKQRQLVMDFGWWSWVSVPLLNTMNFIKKYTDNYGLAIILMVLLIKGLFYPLQSQANKAMKQMQALSPKIKEMQEKYKDDPTKQQSEMMELYKAYGVNPLGGCLPMLVQIPVFFGFYSMLQSAIELRGASFLWAVDLSQPDTVWQIPGLNFPLNPLPILMGLTSLWQMNITPTTTVDKTQATIMKFMPIMFVAMCYNFSSALSLYWTVQNLVGVFQLYHNLNEPAPKLEKKARPKSRWQALMEQAKQQAEMERQSRKKKKQP